MELKSSEIAVLIELSSVSGLEVKTVQLIFAITVVLWVDGRIAAAIILAHVLGNISILNLLKSSDIDFCNQSKVWKATIAEEVNFGWKQNALSHDGSTCAYHRKRPNETNN